MTVADDAREGAEDRKFVTSLARGLEILRCFRPGEYGLTNQQIAERNGLPKPTVTRLTYTLCALGYLIYSEKTGVYQLGPGILGLGYGVLNGMEMRERALPAMEELAQAENVTVALAERHKLKAVYVAVRRAPQTLALSLDVGARLPLAASAIGRAILVAMEPDERRRIMDELAAERPEHAAANAEGLARALEEYRRHGYVSSFGEWKKEIHGIAAPIYSADRERIFAMNVGGPSFLVSPEFLREEMGPRLARAARDLTLAPLDAAGREA
ncbi:IclR family transcriptional regulator [Oceanicella actignis]|uniref:Transcriptional regulator, IclR family n=1 Tax=Oceanicella actignis TaxID=1189325 RepID=A0A1M7SGY9_9RHOB|nr:IclR family transcriptional regulator [Oceanicella actignis]TYO91243.1 IclR family transcriptional regulator [Oceanicella actignis]SET20368.1 transcriptional regulator, IclR family [Oceanicella actignis]SHN57756.1 transcriptional regulator, IclR family [Oceanicella actignis]